MHRHFADRKVLITGGLGFIGSNLALQLLELGAEVTLLDSLIPDYGGNLFNVEPFRDRLRINISDVRDTFSMQHLVRGKDFLFNLAGQTSHLDSMANPMADLEINCRAQLSILEACRTCNPAIKIVFASTRQIYGRPERLPVDEDHPLRPVDVNGINKMAGEKYHLLYSDVHGVKATALRLTNTIGPRMRIKDARQTFVGVWIRQLLEGQPIEVWGGEQLRDFTDVDDAVDALLLAAANPKTAGRVYNLGGPEVIDLAALARLLVEVNGSGTYRVSDFPAERQAIDIGNYYADFSRIRDELGWTPRRFSPRDDQEDALVLSRASAALFGCGMIQVSDPQAGYRAYQSEIDAAIARVLAGGRYILGDEVSAFEKEWAAYLGCGYAVGVGNGTDALAAGPAGARDRCGRYCHHHLEHSRRHRRGDRTLRSVRSAGGCG